MEFFNHISRRKICENEEKLEIFISFINYNDDVENSTTRLFWNCFYVLFHNSFNILSFLIQLFLCSNILYSWAIRYYSYFIEYRGKIVK